jgi:uncharacterized membrane-anchored protein YhcB (DUF1043 family)
MKKIRLRHIVIAGLIIGALAAVIYRTSLPVTKAADKTPATVEEARESIDTVSRDVEAHNIETIEEVRVIRETMAKSVYALDPDELVLSIDEFVGRWRESAVDKLPQGAAGLDF